jgi:hypothetical protein
VVRAEEKLAATGELDAQVGLSTATVAAVHSRQRITGGNCSGHLRPLSFQGVLLNVATDSNIPGFTGSQSSASSPDSTSNHARHFPPEAGFAGETG